MVDEFGVKTSVVDALAAWLRVSCFCWVNFMVMMMLIMSSREVKARR